MLSHLFIATLWSQAGKGLTSWLLMAILIHLYFCYFPMWYPWSVVVLDCIVSWSLPSFLHSFEPRHKISNNVVCAASKGSDQPDQSIC